MHRSTNGPSPAWPLVNSAHQTAPVIALEKSGALKPKKAGSTICLNRCFAVLLVLSLQLVLAPMVAGDSGPLRIQVHFDETSKTMLTTDNRLLLTRIVNVATKAVGDILAVDRGGGKLILQHDCERKEGCSMCGDFKMPSTIVHWNGKPGNKSSFSNGKADFLLFIRVKNSSKCTQQLTWWCHSVVCTSTNRPTSGLLTYCPERIESRHLKSLIASTLRHIIIILGFDKRTISTLYPKRPCPLLLRSNFTCATKEDIAKDTEVLVSTPTVQRFSQTHTGSSTAKGIPFSTFDNGWNSVLMFTSLMADSEITDDIVNHLRLDRASIGVLLDSGWYKYQGEIVDVLSWGRGYSDINSNLSCDLGCEMGVCNYTKGLPCYRLGVSPRCSVCQNFTRLRPVSSTSCIVSSCEASAQRYDLRCVDGAKKKCSKFSKDADCLKFQELCLQPKPRRFISGLVDQFRGEWPPPTPPHVTTERSTPMSRPTTTQFQHPPQTNQRSYRFAFIFAYMDYSVYQMTDSVEKANIKTHISYIVAETLGLPNSTYVQVTKIVSGSTIVHFTVITEKVSIHFVFQKLHEAVDDGDIYIKIRGRIYTATSLKSYDYQVRKAIVTEIIVGTTLGAMLIIGIVSIVIIFVVKKFSRGASVTPAIDGPASDVDSVYRSNSLQTVSVASYALPYELRHEQSSRSVRGVASLRNVSVTDVGDPGRLGNHATADESSV